MPVFFFLERNAMAELTRNTGKNACGTEPRAAASGTQNKTFFY
jgi:hypothetical protein